jgi:outer membrane protein assembly factor BamB
MKKRPLLLAFAVCSLLTFPVLAADWPQWQGPDRTNISKETGLLKTWPAGGPKLLWTFEKGGLGYAGPAVVGDRLYTMGARGGTEYLYALDIKTGHEVWATQIGEQLNNGWGDGPRGTPTVDGDFVYGIGGQGNVICVKADKGDKVWLKSMTKDLAGGKPNWGYTESPLIDGDRLICTPGGRDGTLAALDKKTGQVVWRSKGLTEGAAYSSVIAVDVGGVREYVQMNRGGVAGVNAKDGTPLWTSNEGRNGTAIIPTPIYHDGQVYVTSGYGCGCALLNLDVQGAKPSVVYSNKNLKNQHGGVVLFDGCIYGFSDGNGWVCQDFKTGVNKWEEKRALGKGSLTCAEGKLYCYSENDGTLVLADASPQGWKENGKFKIPQQSKVRSKRGKVWTHPVVAYGKLYLRDQDLIFCYDIRAGK